MLLVCVLELVQQVEHELEHESTTRPKKNTTTKPKRAANPAKTTDSGLPTRSRGILRPTWRTARQDLPVREMYLEGVSSAIFPAASLALYYEASTHHPQACPRVTIWRMLGESRSESCMVGTSECTVALWALGPHRDRIPRSRVLN